MARCFKHAISQAEKAEFSQYLVYLCFYVRIEHAEFAERVTILFDNTKVSLTKKKKKQKIAKDPLIFPIIDRESMFGTNLAIITSRI